MFLLSVQLVWIIAPLILGQYVLAIFCLTRLAYCQIPTRRYVVWNLIILLVFYVGSIVFLTYYFTHRKRLLTEPEPTSVQPELVVDTAIGDTNENSDGADLAQTDTPSEKIETADTTEITETTENSETIETTENSANSTLPQSGDSAEK